MTADTNGNDILAVGIPVTGKLALAPAGTALLTPTYGAQADISALMAPFTLIPGLLKPDGGPQWAWASSGDPITFWQDGYSIPSGLADVTLAITAGEVLSAKVREIVAGITPDQYGRTVIDGGGHSKRWVLYTEEIFKNGAIRRRQAPLVGLQSATEDRSTRGEALGNALVFAVNRSTSLKGHFAEWVLPAENDQAKTVWNVTINDSPTGGTFTLAVNGASTAPLQYNANAAAVSSAINALSGVTGISGVTASGTGPIAVTFPTAVMLTGSSALTGGTNPSVTVA